jgi:RNA polymerase sigma-70 factor, ECF subfamily
MHRSGAIDDGELTARIRQGDAAAEGDLVQLYSRQLLRLLVRITQDHAASEDLYQETFRIVIDRLRGTGLCEPAKLQRFILRTGRNLALDLRRRWSRGGDALPQGDIADPAPGQLDRMIDRERNALVRRLLSEVAPDRYRQILQRFYLAGEDKSRICADLGLGHLHFNRVLFRARRRFRELALRAEAGGVCGICGSDGGESH